MNLTIEYGGGSKFLARTRKHTIICDQPVENNGTDEGMSPPELLLAALGTCAAYYATQYLNTRKLPSEGTIISVSAQKASAPARLGSFRIEARVPSGLPEKHILGISKAIHACLIHNTLLNAPIIDIGVHADQAQPIAS